MKDLKDHITENGIEYVLVGDYYIPQLKLPIENRSIGRWGRLRKTYLRDHRPVLYNQLILTGELWTHLADVNVIFHCYLFLKRAGNGFIRRMRSRSGSATFSNDAA